MLVLIPVGEKGLCAAEAALTQPLTALPNALRDLIADLQADAALR
jgi:hypothetical protein